jgi:hypothetical protein
VDASVRDSVRASVDASVRNSVRDSVGDSVDASVRDSVRASVDASVRNSVRDSVGDSVRASVDAIRKAVNDSRSKSWWYVFGGQFWAGGWWGSPSYVSFFTDVCGLNLPPDTMKAAKAYQETVESACWWWPHRDFVIVSERPLWIDRDERGRLHSETRAAIQWPDGWGLHMWHGTGVPAEWIENRKTLDVRLALTHPQIEQRRAAAEIIGWQRVLAELPHRVVDADTDPTIGTLLSVDLPDAPDSRFLKVLCGTKREFVLPVPREMKTALEANSWTYDVPQIDVKNLEART